MRLILLLTFCVAMITASAQNWCPPGATWTYEAGMALAGFQRMTYTHDTVIGGLTGQVIDRYTAIQYPQPPPGPMYGGAPYISYTPVAVVTRFADDVVYTAYQGVWDTLYWFDANPGDNWTAPHITDTSCAPIVVQDTSTVQIDGVNLRMLTLMQGGPPIYERIGYAWDMMVFCPNWIVDGPIGIRCYSDNDISWSNVNAACEAFVSVDELGSNGSPRIFPNPSNNGLNILNAGPGLLVLTDRAGREVFRTKLQRSLSSFIPEVAQGLYVYHILNAQNNVVASGVWIKVE